jgi:hypothetical protein
MYGKISMRTQHKPKWEGKGREENILYAGEKG